MVLSRIKKNDPRDITEKRNQKARKIMIEIMQKEPFFIWSYESFMFLGEPYLKILYQWLGIKSNYMPEINDGNKKYYSGK